MKNKKRKIVITSVKLFTALKTKAFTNFFYLEIHQFVSLVFTLRSVEMADLDAFF